MPSYPVFAGFSFYLPTKGWKAESTLAMLSWEWVFNPGPLTYRSAALPTELTQPLHTNDWKNAHHFVEGAKDQIFCLTLLGEARLWYHSLEPINVDWQGLQNLFRQQYSRIGNTREQLFHAWRSFSFDENTETTDMYVTCIREVAALLGYGTPQILEVFQTHSP